MNRLFGVLTAVAVGILGGMFVQSQSHPPSYNCPRERDAAIELSHEIPQWNDYPAFAREDAVCHLTEAVQRSHDKPFLPDYLAMLRGENPHPDVCEAKTVEQLLMPCEDKK